MLNMQTLAIAGNHKNSHHLRFGDCKIVLHCKMLCLSVKLRGGPKNGGKETNMSFEICLCSSLCGLSLSHHNTFPSKKMPKHLKKVVKNKHLRGEDAHYGGT